MKQIIVEGLVVGSIVYMFYFNRGTFQRPENKTCLTQSFYDTGGKHQNDYILHEYFCITNFQSS